MSTMSAVTFGLAAGAFISFALASFAVYQRERDYGLGHFYVGCAFAIMALAVKP